jgi:GDPmannose 4,6-dehydratase
MPTAVITGIFGQDGSYLAERLISEGWSVHGISRSIDSSSDSRSKNAPQIHIGDLRNPERLREILTDVQPDLVFNLGGLSSVAESWDNPMDTAIVTGASVVALLDACWQQQLETGKEIRLVQASSAEIFGSPIEVPQSESTRINPVSPYGATKAFAHHMVDVYRRRGLFAASAILYNHESPRRPSTFVTRKITSQVARIVLGADEILALGNLDAKRDWGWAPDYVDAMYRMAIAPVADDYIVATGRSHSVREFVAASFAAGGIEDWDKFTRVDPRFMRPVDAVEMRGDASKALKQLGWKPTVPFEEIVKRMTENDLAIASRRVNPNVGERN